MKIYYVDYRLEGDRWRVDSPFNSRADAERYMEQQIELAQLGIGKSLDGHEPRDFRIRVVENDLED